MESYEEIVSSQLGEAAPDAVQTSTLPAGRARRHRTCCRRLVVLRPHNPQRIQILKERKETVSRHDQ